MVLLAYCFTSGKFLERCKGQCIISMMIDYKENAGSINPLLLSILRIQVKLLEDFSLLGEIHITMNATVN